MIQTTDAKFIHDVVNSPVPIIVDLWAEWCTPCKLLSPVLDELEILFNEDVRIAKLNIDSNPEIPQAYNVKGIPTLLFFNNKQFKGKIVGNVNKESILEKLKILELYPPKAEVPM